MLDLLKPYFKKQEHFVYNIFNGIKNKFFIKKEKLVSFFRLEKGLLGPHVWPISQISSFRYIIAL